MAICWAPTAPSWVARHAREDGFSRTLVKPRVFLANKCLGLVPVTREQAIPVVSAWHLVRSSTSSTLLLHARLVTFAEEETKRDRRAARESTPAVMVPSNASRALPESL